MPAAAPRRVADHNTGRRSLNERTKSERRRSADLHTNRPHCPAAPAARRRQSGRMNFTPEMLAFAQKQMESMSPEQLAEARPQLLLNLSWDYRMPRFREDLERGFRLLSPGREE